MLFRPLTVQEANAFLPFVKDQLVRIQKLVISGQILQQHLDDKKSLNTIKPGPKGEYLSQPMDFSSMRRQVLALDDTVKQEILRLHRLGIVVKSIVPGRVCFLAERYRQPVYLSWQAGENEVTHWHTLDEGFSMRQSVQQPDVFGQHYVQ